MFATEEDIKVLAELRAQLNPSKEISIPRSVLEDVCDYCEYMGIYDKLGNYGDFYYKTKQLLQSH